MADAKISALTAIGSPLVSTQIIPIVEDPAGTAVTKKATLAQVLALAWAAPTITGTLSASGLTLSDQISVRAGQTNVRGLTFFDNNYGMGMDDSDLVLWANSTAGISFKDHTGSGYGGSMLMRIMGTGSVGIGVSPPDTKALLDLTSSTKGFLPPRMTTTQRDAITSVPAGLVVYNTTTSKLNVYTSAWEQVTSA